MPTTVSAMGIKDAEYNDLRTSLSPLLVKSIGKSKVLRQHQFENLRILDKTGYLRLQRGIENEGKD